MLRSVPIDLPLPLGRSGTNLSPTSLYNTISNNSVFYFYAGVRDCVLSLGGPRDKIVSKEDCIPRSGPISVEASCPINIRVDHKLRYGGSMKLKTKIQSALKVAQNALQVSHVWLPRIMHVKTDLLNHV
jgi:hypothetical protein